MKWLRDHLTFQAIIPITKVSFYGEIEPKQTWWKARVDMEMIKGGQSESLHAQCGTPNSCPLYPDPRMPGAKHLAPSKVNFSLEKCSPIEYMLPTLALQDHSVIKTACQKTKQANNKRKQEEIETVQVTDYLSLLFFNQQVYLHGPKDKTI